jgi:hypothetical protein
MDENIDFDIIESYKKPITMPAKYLEVFSVVYKDFFSGSHCCNTLITSLA